MKTVNHVSNGRGQSYGDKYIACYRHRRNEAPEYYRIITGADSVNHAIKLADR